MKLKFKFIQQKLTILLFITSKLLLASFDKDALNKLNFSQLDSLLVSFYNQGNYDQAIACAEAARNLVFKKNGKMDSLYSFVTSDLALLNMKVGKYKLAEKLQLEALNIRSKIFNKNHHDYAASVHNLALLYHHMGQYKKAEPLFIENLAIVANTVGKMHADYAISLTNLATLYTDMGRYKESESLNIKANKIRAKIFGEEHPIYAKSLNSLAVLYKHMGKLEKSKTLQLKALKIRAKSLGKTHPNYATSLTNLASLYKEMGQFHRAEPLYLESLKIDAKTMSTNHPDYAKSLNNLALLYVKMGSFQQAKELYIKSLKIVEQASNKHHPFYASLLNNLASLYQLMGQLNKSEALFKEALNLRKQVIGKWHPDYAANINDLALLYKKMGKYIPAESLFLEALAINKKTIGEKHTQNISNLTDLALISMELGKYKPAHQYICQSVQLLTNITIRSPMDTVWIHQLKQYRFPSNQPMLELIKALACQFDLFALAKTHQARQQQRRLANLAIHLLNKGKNNYIYDQDKLRQIEESFQWMQRSLSILNLKEETEQAFQLAELHKSVLLMEATKATKAFQLGKLPDSLLLLERTLNIKQTELEVELVKDTNEWTKDSVRMVLNEINFQMDTLKRFFLNHYPNYLSYKHQQKMVSINEIQRKLDRHSALIEYVIGDSSIYAFYIDQNQAKSIQLPVHVRLLNKKLTEMNQVIRAFDLLPDTQNQPNQLYQRYVAQAFWCYDKLLRPLIAQDTTITHLIVIPDGQLCHIPFETLLTENIKSTLPFQRLPYLLNNYQVSYHYSAILWKDQQEHEFSSQNIPNGQMLAMASQYQGTYENNLTTRLPAHMRLRGELIPLPAAKKEVETLSNAFKGYFGFDTLATERMFKKLANQYDIIHLAMHGVFNEQFPTLSSLVFTEDQDSLEDNLLQAYEIAKLELQAKLVVLSACQTGYGRLERGNGTASLARAFMYAGTPSLIVSLWQVDDLATSKIMNAFYDHLSDGLNKAEALRQAKLEYIHQMDGPFAHPAYWSAFIQIGNSAPIYIQKKSSFKVWWWVFGVLIIIGVVFVFWRSKVAIFRPIC